MKPTFILEYGEHREDLGSVEATAKRRARYVTKGNGDIVATLTKTDGDVSTSWDYQDGRIIKSSAPASIHRLFPAPTIDVSREGGHKPQRPALISIRLGRKVKNPVERAPRFRILHVSLIS